MATFLFVASPLRCVSRSSAGLTCREIDVMSSDTVRRNFEASSVAEAQIEYNKIVAELTKEGRSWHAYADIARGNRSPRGFKQAKELHFTTDINADAVTVKAAA